ncbi:hypothetical protein bsdcttw_22650 [Anaerocolumna chitinilytica]|uniref:Uncharacterized protein n=1 Tax=Anaerocolumna chitinilytica TaxID=1727145 RepID=A0A7I8DPH7_9FIRM|nr:hypothetical protein bsdcttw_22650 [Anaerocolumna chitinilytica]
MPTGVSILPRLAAAVSKTTVKISLSINPDAVNKIMVKGTKVISATSFVINIEEKKHRRVSTKHSVLAFLKRGMTAKASASKRPMLFRPEMASIRLKRRERVRKSMYSM